MVSGLGSTWCDMIRAKHFLCVQLKKKQCWTNTCNSFDLLTHPLSFHNKCAKMSSSSTSTGSACEEEDLKQTDQPVDVTHSKLFLFTKFVKMDKLQPHEKLIHNMHISALLAGKEIYKDPATGYDVLTRLAHLRRGKCCGNACRHCPFGQQNVPESIPKKKFNSAFYI